METLKELSPNVLSDVVEHSSPDSQMSLVLLDVL